MGGGPAGFSAAVAARREGRSVTLVERYPYLGGLERIALAVADLNGCDYCLAAHSYLGRNLAGLDAAEIAANRAGGSHDAKTHEA